MAPHNTSVDSYAELVDYLGIYSPNATDSYSSKMPTATVSHKTAAFTAYLQVTRSRITSYGQYHTARYRDAEVGSMERHERAAPHDDDTLYYFCYAIFHQFAGPSFGTPSSLLA